MKDRAGRDINVGDTILYARYRGRLIGAVVERVGTAKQKQRWDHEVDEEPTIGVRIVTSNYARDATGKWVTTPRVSHVITLRTPSHITKVDLEAFSQEERDLLTPLIGDRGAQ